MGNWPTYHDYLKSDLWKEKREQALCAAGNKCQVCNSPNKINVHHREYPKNWGDEPQSFLTVLCDRCHRLFHKGPRKKTVKNPRKGRRRNRDYATIRKNNIYALVSERRSDMDKDRVILRKRKAA